MASNPVSRIRRAKRNIANLSKAGYELNLETADISSVRAAAENAPAVKYRSGWVPGKPVKSGATVNKYVTKARETFKRRTKGMHTA